MDSETLKKVVVHGTGMFVTAVMFHYGPLRDVKILKDDDVLYLMMNRWRVFAPVMCVLALARRLNFV